MNFKWSTNFDDVPVGEYVLLTVGYDKNDQTKRYVTIGQCLLDEDEDYRFYNEEDRRLLNAIAWMDSPKPYKF